MALAASLAAFSSACHTLVRGSGSFSDCCITTGLGNTLLICGHLLFLNSTQSQFSLQRERMGFSIVILEAVLSLMLNCNMKNSSGAVVMTAPTVLLYFGKVICAYLVACVSIIAPC